MTLWILRPTIRKPMTTGRVHFLHYRQKLTFPYSEGVSAVPGRLSVSDHWRINRKRHTLGLQQRLTSSQQLEKDAKSFRNPPTLTKSCNCGWKELETLRIMNEVGKEKHWKTPASDLSQTKDNDRREVGVPNDVEKGRIISRRFDHIKVQGVGAKYDAQRIKDPMNCNGRQGMVRYVDPVSSQTHHSTATWLHVIGKKRRVRGYASSSHTVYRKIQGSLGYCL